MSRPLIFAVSVQDVPAVCSWLKDNGYFPETRCRKNFMLVSVDIGGEPGRAGRAFDIGYMLKDIEMSRPEGLRFAGSRGFSKKNI